MGQIVRRKKKGRPSKADLARRSVPTEMPRAGLPDKHVRRSLRRRNVRYIFDFDDFIDEDEVDEEDELRREKKLKLLLKLQNKEGGAESAPDRTRRVPHASAASASSSDPGDGVKPLKKRKMNEDDEVEGDVDDGDDGNGFDDGDEEVRSRKTGSKGADSVPGTPRDPPLGLLPLPDKKLLELILDKLQKKDTYGVYAEPVDPGELPDYHDVIEHPMDFATVRKKLGNGSYSTLEQFENDVFLICTNAMQYNAPDTIYYKQARSIQELAKKKFDRLRIDAEHCEKELNSEQKTRSSFLAKKQIKKPMSRTAQEPVGSDFSSGATLATAGDFQGGSIANQTGGFERFTNVDGPAEGNTSLIDNNLDKAEDLQGRGLLSRFGRKPFLHDDNRRATYSISSQPIGGSESIFTTFDSESKQLVPVGLQADHSYARSLARFAATLGLVAWNVASRRIEQALPPGFKFGRGWVGDYEPLPTPVLTLENCSPKEPAFLTKLHCTLDSRKDDKTSKTPVPVHGHPITFPTRSSLFGAPSVNKPTVTLSASATVPAKEQSIRGTKLEGKQPFFGSGGSQPTAASANYQQQSPRSRNNEMEKKVVKHVELNCPPTSANQNARDFITQKQLANSLDVPASRSVESFSRNRNLLQSVPSKQPENNGLVARLPNGKLSSNSLDRNRVVASSFDSIPNQMVSSATYFPRGQEQGLSDPVQLMSTLAENAQKQQKSLNRSPGDNLSAVPSVSSSRIDDSNNATAAAARAWMSIGAGGSKTAAENTNTHKQILADSLYNPARELQPQVSRFPGEFPLSGMQFQPVKNSFPLPAFVTPHIQAGSEAQFQNKPLVFPRLVTADLSRFQVHSPRQGLNPRRQQMQKQESLPPDLNIGFQSSGSPVRQSSGVLVDSQQPDLALQL